MDHVIGVGKNARLTERIGWELADTRAEADRHGRPARRFAEFPHATRTNWSRRRRVVAKAEHLPGKANPRFVVTSLPVDMFSACAVYGMVDRHGPESAARPQTRQSHHYVHCTSHQVNWR